MAVVLFLHCGINTHINREELQWSQSLDEALLGSPDWKGLGNLRSCCQLILWVQWRRIPFAITLLCYLLSVDSGLTLHCLLPTCYPQDLASVVFVWVWQENKTEEVLRLAYERIQLAKKTRKLPKLRICKGYNMYEKACAFWTQQALDTWPQTRATLTFPNSLVQLYCQCHHSELV